MFWDIVGILVVYSIPSILFGSLSAFNIEGWPYFIKSPRIQFIAFLAGYIFWLPTILYVIISGVAEIIISLIKDKWISTSSSFMWWNRLIADHL